MTDRIPGFSTLAVHAGAQPDPTTGARATPIYQTTSFVFNDADHAASLFGLAGVRQYLYADRQSDAGGAGRACRSARRRHRGTGGSLRPRRAGRDCSSMLLNPGDEFIAARKLYGGSINQFTHAFKSFGWNVVWADPDDIESFERAVTPHTKAIFIEFDRQSRRHDHRHRGDRGGGAQGRRSPDRR